MERCILTGKLLSNNQVVSTLEGPIAAFLWGRNKVVMDDGIALIPVSFLTKFREKVGRDPLPESLEDRGRCLNGEG